MKRTITASLAAIAAAGALLTTPAAALAAPTAYGAPGGTAGNPTVLAASSRYTVDQLKGVKLKWMYFSGDQAYVQHDADGFDYRNPGPYTMPYGDTHAGVTNLPAGWYVTGSADMATSTDNWSVHAPDGTVVITYVIGRGGSQQPQSGLDGIVAYVNGSRLAQWNPNGNSSYDSTVTGRFDYNLAAYPNAAVSFGNVPSGWRTDVQTYGSTLFVTFYGNGMSFTSPTYTFSNAKYSAATAPSQPSTPSQPTVTPSGYQPIYRAYNPRIGKHFYTASAHEYQVIQTQGWRGENIAFYQPTNTGSPVYRAYHGRSGDHHFTLSAREYSVITAHGWRAEGVAWKANPTPAAGEQPVYRAYNPHNGEHLFTMSQAEYANLKAHGWRQEGIAWYAKA